MALRVSSFFFKKVAVPIVSPQRAITKSEVEAPGLAVATDIVAIYDLDGDKTVADPNTLGLYGTWSGIPETYVAHTGSLNDYAYGQYLSGVGAQINGWGAGTLDTYYNTAGMTFSWIQRLTFAIDGRLMQYWQADLEYIDLFYLDEDTIQLAVSLGTGTLQTVDIILDDFNASDNTFHHYLVSFDPTGERIARLFIDGVLAGATLAVTGTAVFGDEATNIRRGISFGSAYTATNANTSGDIDHIVILLGTFAPDPQFFDNRMMVNGIYVKYLGDQMTYNPE